MSTRARDIMTQDVISIPKDMNVREAALVLTTHRITGAPVIDAEHSLVGVVSSMDLVRNSARMVTSKKILSPYFTKLELEMLKELQSRVVPEDQDPLFVSDVMTPYAVSAQGDTLVDEVARIMIEQCVHRVLILDKGQLIGIVSSMDIAHAIAEHGLADHSKGSASRRRRHAPG